MNRYLLLCANDYLNSNLRVYGSINSANTFKQLLALPETNVTELYNSDATTSNLKNEMTKLSNKLKCNGNIGFVFYAGHGDNVRSNNNSEFNMEDYYRMSDGIVSDLDISELFDGSNLLIIVSDCCSSAHDILNVVDGKPFQGDWISFGATMEFEDDMQSDLGVLTEAISTNFDLLKNATVKEINEILTNWIQISWVGNLQHCSIQVSNETLWEFRPFKF